MTWEQLMQKRGGFGPCTSTSLGPPLPVDGSLCAFFWLMGMILMMTVTAAYYLPTNGKQPGRPPPKRWESQTQGIRSQRCSKCSEVGHTRRTFRNAQANFDANYEGDVVKVEDLFDGSYITGH